MDSQILTILTKSCGSHRLQFWLISCCCMSRFGVGWGGVVTFIPRRSWHETVDFSFRYSWGLGVWGGAITSFHTCTHMMLRFMLTSTMGLTMSYFLNLSCWRCSTLCHWVWVVCLVLTCAWGLTRRMCFARCSTSRHGVWSFWVVRFMLTCILDGDTVCV